MAGNETDLCTYFNDEFEGVDGGASDQFYLHPTGVSGVIWQRGGVVVELLLVPIGGSGRGRGRESVVDCDGAKELLNGLEGEEEPWVC